jgi:hypothetical protein
MAQKFFPQEKAQKNFLGKVLRTIFPKKELFNLDATKLENRKVQRVRNHQNFLQENSGKNFFLRSSFELLDEN